MRLNFAFKQLDRSEALEKHTLERVENIGRFLLRDGYGSVYISKTKNEFCVEISVNTREKYFKAVSIHSDVYQAVDSVVEKLEKQFLKNRKTVQNHKHPELSKAAKLDQMNDRFEQNQKFKKAA